jgi:hypothetical protein
MRQVVGTNTPLSILAQDVNNTLSVKSVITPRNNVSPSRADLQRRSSVESRTTSRGLSVHDHEIARCFLFQRPPQSGERLPTGSTNNISENYDSKMFLIFEW